MSILILRTASGLIEIHTPDVGGDPDPGSLEATHNLTAGWATFGQVIPEGAVPAGSAIQVGSLATQCDVKTSWGDGSARFAVLTCKPTGTGDQALSVVAAGSGTFTPTIPTASVVLTIGGTAWTATLPGTVSGDLWLDGSQVKEWRSIVTPINPSATPHAFLRVYFDARVYSDGQARVDITVENNLDVAEGTKVTYDVAITVSGSSVFTQSAVVHYYLTRWRKAFGVGLSESTVALDWEPAFVAGALPRYMDATENPTYSTAGDTFAILGRGGNTYDRMGTTGGRAEIAPYPDWAARFLTLKAADQREYVLANGDLAGSWPIHIRESDGSLVSIDDRPQFWLDLRGQEAGYPVDDRPKGDLSDANASTLVPDLAHVPSFSYVPYLATGDRYYADELAFWGNYALVGTYPVPLEDFGRGESLGIVGVEQVRARAWSLRNLTDAAAYAPDGGLRDYLGSKVANNLEYYDTYAQASTLPLDLMFAGREGDTMTSIQWMKNYFLWAMDHAQRQGFSGGEEMISRLLTFALRLYTSSPDYPREYAGSYHLIVGSVAGDAETYCETMAEIFAANYVNPADSSLYDPVPFEGFYGIDGRIALLLCIDRGRAGAQDALDWLEPQIPGDLASLAGWLISPYA
jgi:hypothetical protein